MKIYPFTEDGMPRDYAVESHSGLTNLFMNEVREICKRMSAEMFDEPEQKVVEPTEDSEQTENAFPDVSDEPTEKGDQTEESDQTENAFPDVSDEPTEDGGMGGMV